jgi:SAM-dependent methyltransferase
MPPRPTNIATELDVLRFYVTHSPPDHALWKTIEWRLFRAHQYPAPVLDLGCGDGVFAELVFDQPLLSGIDILRHRVRKAQHSGMYAQALTGDATRMPYADGSFRTVFSGCAMEHVPDMPAMLHEIARVLQPGGHLITTVPSGYFADYLWVPTVLRRWGLGGAAARYGALIVRLLMIMHMYHPAHWTALLDAAGLELVEARHFLPRESIALFDQLLVAGNLVQPLVWLLRGSRLHQQYVEWMVGKLAPHIHGEARLGGALLLVARKRGE